MSNDDDIDKLRNEAIKELEADNARLRQQLQSLVEAWKIYEASPIASPIKANAMRDLRAAFLAVQSAQETEEK